MGERDQLGQRRHPARVQLFQAGGMTQLSRPVQREHQLSVDRLFGPQGAVIVEYRDTLGLVHEIG
jgi:hypothetical protein